MIRQLARVALLTLLIACGVARAELELSPLFSNHMVMQRDMPVPVWGFAEPGERVTVRIDQQSKSATAGDDGKWTVRLDPMTLGEPRKMTVEGKSGSIEVNDILLGEVWVCAGQSNMAWPVSLSKEPGKVATDADVPQLRVFDVGNPASSTPLVRMNADPKLNPDASLSKNPRCQWNLSTPETVKGFSAVGYHFGRELHRQTKVPVGLICNAVGGTAIESWTSTQAMRDDPDYRAIPEYFDHLAKWLETPEGKAAYDAKAARYEEQQQELKKAGKPFKWPRNYRPRTRETFPGVWFNARVNPIVPYAIRGVIWYQGEAHTWGGKDDRRAETPLDYRGQLPLLINDWREHWGQGDFPFLIAELATFGAPLDKPTDDRGWPIVREAQQMALRLPNTGLAVTLDLGEPGTIHPGNKQDVGYRLALVARAKVYGESITYSGPVYREMKIDGASIRLHFDHVGAGLMVGRKDGLLPAQEDRDGKLQRFSIAGEDMKWTWANAVIDGETVVVSSPDVPRPIAVRYAWESAPAPLTLYNRDGLPCSSFRTDTSPTFVKAAVYKAKLARSPSLGAAE